MQVFKTFLKVLRKHLGIAALYIVLFLAVGAAMTLMDDSRQMFEQTRLDICVFDEDGTPESKALCALIGQKHNLVTLEKNDDVILDALYYERVNYVLTIKRGYGEKLAAGDTEGLLESRHFHESYSTVYTEQFLNEYVGTVRAFIAGGDSPADAVAHAEAAFAKEVSVNTANFEPTRSSDSQNNTALYFRYLPYLIFSVLMNVLCPVLLVMNKKEIRSRTDCSGIRPGRFTAEVFAGTALFVIGIWLLFVAVSVPVNGCMYQGRMWLAVLNSFVFTLFSAAFALLVSSFSPAPNIINIITQIVSLGMCFLCGVFVDQSMLGDGVLSAARFLPAYWYIRVNRMLEGAEVYDGQFAAKAIAIEAAFVVVLALLTVMLRKSHVRTPKPQRKPA